MHGFISESTSKITDGLWSAAQLTLLSFLIGLLSQFFSDQASSALRLCFLIILMAGGTIFMFRSLSKRLADTNRAMSGMVAGLLFWQSVLFPGLFEQSQFIQTGGYLLWLGSAILISLFWVKALPTGMRFSLMVIMVHWIGRLLINSLSTWSGSAIRPVLLFGSARLAGAILFGTCLLFIVGYSSYPVQRRYAAVGLYSGILLTFLLF